MDSEILSAGPPGPVRPASEVKSDQVRPSETDLQVPRASLVLPKRVLETPGGSW